MTSKFFYNEQIRRFLVQFIRAFSNFQVQYSDNTLVEVPVKYGDATRMVSSIIRENSENKVIPTPMMSCYITGLQYNPERRTEPTFVDKRHIRLRDKNPNTGEYTNNPGPGYTVERLMPVPYTLEMNLDIWTSNTTQKLQLLEQLVTLFNPALEIQSTDNYLDWGSLSYIELQNVTWSSRTVGGGTEDEIDVATLSFIMPIYLSAPAKVKKLGIVNKIIASIYDESGDISDGVIDTGLLLENRMKFTPTNYGVLIVGNTAQIIDYYGTTTNKVEYDPLNDPPEKVGDDDVTWQSLINQYGELQPGISQIRLETSVGEVVGTIALDTTNPHRLLFTLDEDTIPTNDFDPVDKIINPLTKAPGAGLAEAAEGQRYLILNATGDASNTDNPDGWKGTDGTALVAGANDIIEYDGVKWIVSFDSSEESGVHYVKNLTSGVQYRWTGSEWVRSWEGEYQAGNWSLVL